MRGRAGIVDLKMGMTNSFQQEAAVTSGYFPAKPARPIITGSEDKTVRIWSLDPIKEILRLEVDEPVLAATFNGDGILAVATRTRLGPWVIDPQRLLAAACQSLPGNLPALLWERFLSAPYRPACPGLRPLP
jgi:hypothetical protein